MINAFIFMILISIIKAKLQPICSLLDANIGNSFLNFANFKSFEELKFKDCQIDMRKYAFITGITFMPNHDLILNKSLNFSGLRLTLAIPSFVFAFFDLKGLDTGFNSFKDVQLIENIEIYQLITHSNLKLYHQNKFVTNCNELIHDMSRINIFQNIFYLRIFYTVIYKENTCPLLFTNAACYITFDGISESFIKKNFLTFSRLNVTKIPNDIQVIEITMYHVNLDKRLLSDQLFYNLKHLALNGQINLIENDLLKYFSKLKSLKIRNENIQNMFKRNNKWLKYLNYKMATLRFLLLIYQTTPIIEQLYSYPDEDLCYFQNFPHNQSVYPVLKPQNQTNCTCTKLFLLQFTKRKQFILTTEFTPFYIQSYLLYTGYHYDDMITGEFNSECSNDNLDEQIKFCEFEKRFENCHPNSFLQNEHKFYFYISDWKQLDGKSEFVVSIILIPLFCFISILITVLTILILSDKELIDHKLYKYLKLNCYFNVLYLIIISFKMISYCRSSYSDLFCSYYYAYPETDYFIIICVKLIGNSLKSSSNFAYTMFSLSRYIIVTNRTKSKFRYLDKQRPIVFMLITFLASISLNCYTYLEFSSKSNFFIKREAIYDDPDGIYDTNEYTINHNSSYFYVLYSLNIIKIIIADILLMIANIIIDCLLFSFVKRKQIKKRTLNLALSSAILSKELKLNRNKKRDKASLNRITGLIVLNGVNFLIFRLPSLLISFYDFIFYKTTSNHFMPTKLTFFFCKNLKFCFLLNEVAILFYLFSFLVQFFILYKVDINFSRSFKKLIDKLRKK